MISVLLGVRDSKNLGTRGKMRKEAIIDVDSHL